MRDEWQYRFHEKKLSVINLPLSLREILDKRARGESKTFDTMESPGLYLSHLGFKGIWFGAAKDQIEQPKKYMKWIIENSFLKYMIGDLLKESVEFQNGGSLRLKNLTEMNARSSRADFIVYDEESKADQDAYNAAVNILAGSELGLIVHISTPEKASPFEINYDRLKRREIIHNEQFIFSRTWEDASWLRAKRDWYEEQKRILPDWYFRQEHMAEFILPHGAVFQNVIYDPYPEHIIQLELDKDTPNCSGVDWNPAAGHVRSTIKWTPDLQNIVVVGEAMFSSGYARELKEKEFMVLRPWFSQGNRMVLEDGGINIPYIDWFNDMLESTRHNWREQQWNTEEWDNQDIAKMKACTYVIQHGITIYVDESRFEKTAKQIEECSWDDKAMGSNPKLKKDKANSPHFLDAFLHAISDKNRDDLRYEVADW